MKVVLLAGGLGTRISEESVLKPKPMIEIGGKPILWHIMKLYAHYGLDDFIICLGYKGQVIKDYFSNYVLYNSDITIDAKHNKLIYHQNQAEPWRITLVDTGYETMTGGRLRRVAAHLDEHEPFCFTYGDGVGDIDIAKLISFHKTHGREATLSAVIPPGRYGAVELQGDKVNRFVEKPPGDNSFINGGFFVLNPSVLGRIESDDTSWERAPLEGLAKDGELQAYRHTGFWQAMDTLRDKNFLESLWQSGAAPWKVWE